MSVGGVIAVTEPRRVAAMRLAERVAEETGSFFGGDAPGSERNYRATTQEDRIGYSVRFDSFKPKGMKIKYLTEGMLLQELLIDPHLRKYSAVIIDEIHERSVDVDLVAGFIKQILTGDKSGRGGVPLKVVVMSATADMEKLSNFFNANLLAHNEDNDTGTSERGKPSRLSINGKTYSSEKANCEKLPEMIEDSLIPLTRLGKELAQKMKPI